MVRRKSEGKRGVEESRFWRRRIHGGQFVIAGNGLEVLTGSPRREGGSLLAERTINRGTARAGGFQTCANARCHGWYGANRCASANPLPAPRPAVLTECLSRGDR